jgi:hypothetical protein
MTAKTKIAEPEKEVSEAQESKTAESKKTVSQEVELTEAQWEQVFQHSRFKELNDKAKKAEAELTKVKEAEEKAKQDKLKEEGKLQELLEAKDKELEALKNSFKQQKVESQIVSVASRLNVVDTDAVARLIDTSKFEYDDEGNPTNTEDVVKALLSDKPYLAKEGTTNVGSDANTSTESQNANFVITQSELKAKLKDHKWYEDNKDNITQWQKEGRIDYTR